MAYNEILLQENPYNSRWYGSSRSRSRKNPTSALAMPKGVGEFFQGVSVMDAGASLAGFAGAVMLPGAIIKVADTTGKKIGKFSLALGSAGIVGLAAKTVGGMSAARAAVAGGLAGALAQALSSFAGVEIGKGTMLGSSRPIRRLGTSTVVSPSMTRAEETVSLITP